MQREALKLFHEETGADEIDHVGFATPCPSHDNNRCTKFGSLHDHQDLHVAVMCDRISFTSERLDSVRHVPLDPIRFGHSTEYILPTEAIKQTAICLQTECLYQFYFQGFRLSLSSSVVLQIVLCLILDDFS